ncbi:MAG: M14 family metallopeptidase [Pseudomonadota bacterium]
MSPLPDPLVLDRLNALPQGLADVSARDIRTVFPNSALIHLDGRRELAPLALGVLLHGDETVGLTVLQRLQAWMKRHPLPRPMIIFVGNVHAAEAGLRKLPGRADYNRVWSGGDSPEAALAQTVLAEVKRAEPFALIDLHNNTGANPHYACVHNMRPDTLQLASLFSRLAVRTLNPPTLFSIAMSGITPAITAECGRPGEPTGEEAAFNMVLDALHLDHWRGAPDLDLQVFDVTGRIEIAPDARIAFEHGIEGDIELPAKLESWNFFERPAGSTFARLLSKGEPLRVVDGAGADVTGRFFTEEGDRLILRRAATPAMLTVSEAAIRADCLGYLMEAAG